MFQFSKAFIILDQEILSIYMLYSRHKSKSVIWCWYFTIFVWQNVFKWITLKFKMFDVPITYNLDWRNRDFENNSLMYLMIVYKKLQLYIRYPYQLPQLISKRFSLEYAIMQFYLFLPKLTYS